MIKDSFRTRVLKIVSGITRGQVMTYKQVAHLAGRPRAYRAVGNILSKNHDLRVPCHRVIRSNGSPGGYNKGTADKIKLLKKEGAI